MSRKSSGRTATVVLSLLCVPAVFVALAAVLGPIDAAPEIDDASVTPEYDENGAAVSPLSEPRLRSPILDERGPDGDNGTARSASSNRALGLTLLGPDITDVIVGTSADAMPHPDTRTTTTTSASATTDAGRPPRSDRSPSGDAQPSRSTRSGVPPVIPSLPDDQSEESSSASNRYSTEDGGTEAGAGGDDQVVRETDAADAGRPDHPQG